MVYLFHDFAAAYLSSVKGKIKNAYNNTTRYPTESAECRGKYDNALKKLQCLDDTDRLNATDASFDRSEKLDLTGCRQLDPSLRSQADVCYRLMQFYTKTKCRVCGCEHDGQTCKVLNMTYYLEGIGVSTFDLMEYDDRHTGFECIPEKIRLHLKRSFMSPPCYAMCRNCRYALGGKILWIVAGIVANYLAVSWAVAKHAGRAVTYRGNATMLLHILNLLVENLPLAECKTNTFGICFVKSDKPPMTPREPRDILKMTVKFWSEFQATEKAKAAAKSALQDAESMTVSIGMPSVTAPVLLLITISFFMFVAVCVATFVQKTLIEEVLEEITSGDKVEMNGDQIISVRTKKNTIITEFGASSTLREPRVSITDVKSGEKEDGWINVQVTRDGYKTFQDKEMYVKTSSTHQAIFKMLDNFRLKHVIDEVSEAMRDPGTADELYSYIATATPAPATEFEEDKVTLTVFDELRNPS